MEDNAHTRVKTIEKILSEPKEELIQAEIAHEKRYAKLEKELEELRQEFLHLWSIVCGTSSNDKMQTV